MLILLLFIALVALYLAQNMHQDKPSFLNITMEKLHN